MTMFQALAGLSWGFAGAALLAFLPELRWFSILLPRSRPHWDEALCLVRDLREKLESGWLPSEEHWQSLSALEPPWGELAIETISEFRAQGIAVTPTLRRLEKIFDDQKKADHRARARSAQAWGQAVVCGAIVPLISAALFFLVPGLIDLGWKWLWVTAIALFLDAIAMAWMLSLAEAARWAGISKDRRCWWGAAHSFGERLLGSLRGGLPADLAWSRAVPQLQRLAPDLLTAWGADLWSPAPGLRSLASDSASRRIAEQGESLRRAIQASIYEGKGCAERIEASFAALQAELECEVERQIQLLSTRALKPLFLLVAPSVLLLLVLAFSLSWSSWSLA
ncbi:MAG: hypothetical protein RJB38_1586 [Pseudomonadota bacterium]|jgi:hypothetical protein